MLVIGGAMANTFLAAQGHAIGKSLQEAEMHDTAREILAGPRRMAARSAADRCGGRRGLRRACDRTVAIERCRPTDDPGRRAGHVPPDAARRACQTLVWNGPLGAFETPPFDAATVGVAQAVAALTQSAGLKSSPAAATRSPR